jgi:hypothetical protein|tara:strand:- start:8411 stop:8692 length:282 start_codon:yes stop_codon:yes gene_type:complete
MPLVFLIRPVVIKVRKFVAKKKGLDYIPLLPKFAKKIEIIIVKLKKRIMPKKMNEYFTKMNKAKKSNAKSFEYKGNTYIQVSTKTGMKIYKKK